MEVFVNGQWVEQAPVAGDKVRSLVGTGDFQHYVETIYFVISEEELARSWRNSELELSDFMVPIIDHPQHAAYLVYRQALRDWPDSEEFPNTKPTL